MGILIDRNKNRVLAAKNGKQISSILAVPESDDDLTYAIYQKKTGKPWFTAKEEGLTDGSYEQNMILRKRLLNNEDLGVGYIKPEDESVIKPRVPVKEKTNESVSEIKSHEPEKNSLNHVVRNAINKDTKNIKEVVESNEDNKSILFKKEKPVINKKKKELSFFESIGNSISEFYNNVSDIVSESSDYIFEAASDIIDYTSGIIDDVNDIELDPIKAKPKVIKPVAPANIKKAKKITKDNVSNYSDVLESMTESIININDYINSKSNKIKAESILMTIDGFSKAYDIIPEKAQELIMSIKDEGIGNAYEQVKNYVVQEYFTDVAMAQFKVDKPKPIAEQKYLPSEVNQRNLNNRNTSIGNNLIEKKIYTNRNGKSTRTFSKSLNKTKIYTRNRGDKNDIKGNIGVYTYAPFKTYNEHNGNKYANLKMDGRNHSVIAINSNNELVVGKSNDYKETNTKFSPTYIIDGVSEIVLSGNNKFFSGINQKGIGLKTESGIKYIPFGVGNGEGNNMGYHSGGHFMFENPKTNEIIILHGSGKNIQDGVKSYMNKSNINNINVIETNHKTYSVIGYNADNIHKGTENIIKDNVNSKWSGSGNFIYYKNDLELEVPAKEESASNSALIRYSDILSGESSKKTTPTINHASPVKMIENKTTVKSIVKDVETVFTEASSKTKQQFMSRVEAFSEEANSFAVKHYANNNLKNDYYFVIDKPTQAIFKINIRTGKSVLLGKVGLGRNVGNRDVSGGRKTGGGTNKTQAGWVRINREAAFAKRSASYGDEFNGFEALVDDKWKEIPTGIHGTGHEAEGRVSGGCTRLSCELEDALAPFLTKGTLLYYTSD